MMIQKQNTQMYLLSSILKLLRCRKTSEFLETQCPLKLETWKVSMEREFFLTQECKPVNRSHILSQSLDCCCRIVSRLCNFFCILGSKRKNEYVRLLPLISVGNQPGNSCWLNNLISSCESMLFFFLTSFALLNVSQIYNGTSLLYRHFQPC